MPIARQGGLLFDFPSGKSQSARRLSGPPGSAAGSVLSTKYSPSRLGHPGQSHCSNRLRLQTRCGLRDRFLESSTPVNSPNDSLWNGVGCANQVCRLLSAPGGGMFDLIIRGGDVVTPEG